MAPEKISPIIEALPIARRCWALGNCAPSKRYQGTIGDVPIVKLVRELIPFIIAITVVLFLITYIPGLVLWLPTLVMGSVR